MTIVISRERWQNVYGGIEFEMDPWLIEGQRKLRSLIGEDTNTPT